MAHECHILRPVDIRVVPYILEFRSSALVLKLYVRNFSLDADFTCIVPYALLLKHSNHSVSVKRDDRRGTAGCRLTVRNVN